MNNKKSLYINLQKELLNSIRKRESLIDENIKNNTNITTFPISSKQIEVNNCVNDILENGYVATEFELITNCVIYLFFERQLLISEEECLSIIEDILLPQNLAEFLNSLEKTELVEDGVELLKSLIDNPDFLEINALKWVPIFITWTKYRDFFPSKLIQARDLLDKNPDSLLYKEVSSRSYTEWRAWIVGEIEPGTSKKEIEVRNLYLDSIRKKDRIFGDNPEKILLTPSKKNQAIYENWKNYRFDYWCYLLFQLLSSKRINEQRYIDVALEVGQKAYELIWKADAEGKEKYKNSRKFEYLNHLSDEELLESCMFSKRKNTALKKYVKFLVDLGKLENAINVCNSCIEHGIQDGTIEGFKKSRDRILEKLNKKTTKVTRGRKGKVDPSAIAHIVMVYKTLNSEGKIKLAEEYGISMSNLYYIISKNSNLNDRL
jgi:hypothetical protein